MQCEAPFATPSSIDDKPFRPVSRDAAAAQPVNAIENVENEGRKFLNGIVLAVLLEVAVAGCVYGLWHAFLLIR